MKPKRVAYFFLQYLVYCIFIQSSNGKKCKVKLNSNNFMVQFHPYVRSGVPTDAYNETEMMPMIETMATRFTSFEIATVINQEKYNFSHIYAASAVAKYNANQNKNHNSNGKLSNLQLILRFKIFDSDSSPEDKNSSFNIVRDLANKANQIFPKTVTTLTLDYFEFNENNWERMVEQLQYSKSAIANETSDSYNLGAIIYLTSCENTVGQQFYMKHVVQPLDYIFLYIRADTHDHEAGVDTAVKYFIQRFKTCKKILQSYNPDMKVALRTSWQDTDFNGKQNLANLVRFWGKINKFAQSENTPVVLLEAFDQPRWKDNRSPYHTQGWWKLDKEASSNGEYKFVEKCSLVPEDALNDEGIVDDSNVKIGALDVGVYVIVFLMLLLIVLFVYFKLRKQRRGDQEIKEFFEGKKSSPGGNEYGELDKIDAIAYDKSHEIGIASFNIEDSVSLGAGEFGTVSLGNIQKDGRKISAAVKSAKKEASLKSLMGEIKVLSYIGVHSNIIQFLGAYTAELKSGVLLVFLELCPLGSLQKYLRRHSSTEIDGDGIVLYLDLTEGDETDKKDADHIVDIHVMLQWSRDIISGMEYLVSKQLMHGDLATRNILLDRERKAKICDFGLSRRLYEYSSYLKSQGEPLPWRWMSPESLRRLEFNEKTDVWAFGVTIWEICSFGDVPYPGLNWTLEFLEKLDSGLRMGQPSICPPELYEVMLQCWNISSDARPTFSQLMLDFQKMI